MSDNLKTQKFNIIIINKFCQKIKVWYFCYINCERQPKTGRFLCIVNARPSNLWWYEWPRSMSLVFGCNYNRKFFRNQILKEKIKIFVLWENTYHTIFIYGKMLIIEFSYNFLYVWNCMKLYDKKFLIYGNCMIRSFDQPGISDYSL